MDRVTVYVLTSLSIDSDGNVASRNVGATFDVFEAEAHRAKGVENEFETFAIGRSANCRLPPPRIPPGAGSMGTMATFLQLRIYPAVEIRGPSNASSSAFAN